MEWRELLKRAVQIEGSQAKVAIKLGYSSATMSMVIGGTYNGDVDKIASKVKEVYGGKNMKKEVPTGYMLNKLGHLVPVESIKEVDLARDEFVKDIIGRAKDVNEQLWRFKKSVADDAQAFFELSAERYGADAVGSKNNFTLLTYDGKYKLVRENVDRIDFDERLQVAKLLVDECLQEWSKVAGPELRTIVEGAFKVNKKGTVNIKQILSLRKHKIDDPTWKRAMEAISDAVEVVGSCIYYRMYERDDEGKYRQICLDFSGV